MSHIGIYGRAGTSLEPPFSETSAGQTATSTSTSKPSAITRDARTKRQFPLNGGPPLVL